ncbi:uncharacterized protein I303_108151 [Kwoniella dejecticola CBS 10117]|uniref:DUF6604 domain-containing protein n=1 Tax=Kwoniella dejecticola CBS 10117 TaxID=1296121 RepID=A0A1A5ZY67_9TREE|nr:uncharacterized protein I303_07523 [Kwoniella dejecticola CBS 10117]OBR82756.1 hypothetical protein I303_07523 [Kwoniella dejecticola CBS 10117]
MSRLIRSKYQQYKRDNDQLTSWLANAAVQYGYPISSFTQTVDPVVGVDEKPTPSQQKNAKKKAKARAKARAKGDTGGLEKSGISEDQGIKDAMEEDESTDRTAKLDIVQGNRSAPHLELSRHPYRSHAPSPALHSASIQLPEAVPSHSQRFHRRSRPLFVNVLTEVYNLFEEHKNSVSTGNGKPDPHSPSVNRYTELPYTDKDEEPEELADIFIPKHPCPSSAPPVDIACAPEYSREELVLGVLAFLEDMHDIRDEIMDIWGRYQAGQIDLTTAAVTSNTALELLRKPHDDIVKTVLPAFNHDIKLLLMTLYNVLKCSFAGGAMDLQPPLYSLIDDEDLLTSTIYEHLLIPVCQMLSGMADVIQDGLVPVYKVGHFGYYNPKMKFFKQPFTKRWHQAQILMCETLTDYFLLGVVGERSLPSAPVCGNEKSSNIFFIDEIAAEMSTFSRTKAPTLLLMVYCQVFIDINFVLGSEANRGVKELRSAASDMFTSYSRRQNIEPEAPESIWHSENRLIDKAFLEELDCWRRMVPLDLVYKSIEGRLPLQCSIFDRDPLLCGLMLFRLRLKYQHLGLSLANSFGSILSTAHLFAACKRSGVLPGEKFNTWEDMELVMDLHGKEDIFGGKYPDNIDDSLASFLRMMGYSTEVQGASRHVYTGNPLPSYLNKPKKKFSLLSKSGPKGLTDHAQILPIFSGKYLRDPSAGTSFGLNSVETLLSDILADEAKQSAIADKKYTIRRKRNHRSHKFSILQLLSILEAGLEAETRSIRFDYVSMHLRCLTILKKVQLSADEYFTRKLGPLYLENDSQLPFIVGWILNFAAFSGRAAESISIRREGRKAVDVRSQRLTDATRVMKEYLISTGEGDSECKKMRHTQ